MNRLTLVFTAVLALALAATASAAAGPIATAVEAAAGPASLTKYMPKDATVVIAVDWSKLAETGLFDMIEEMSDEDTFEELEALGIDIEEDITQMMVAVVIDPEDIEADPAIYIAVAGNLPSEKKFVELYEEEEGEEPESRKVEGKTVYDIEDVDICFLPGVMLFAPKEDVEADIANMLTGGLAANATLTSLMKDTDTKATVWGVASLSKAVRDAIAEEEENGDDETALKASALKSVAGSFNYAEKVALDVQIGFTNKEAAAELVEMFNTQVKPLGEQLAEMMPEAAELIKALKMNATGSKATVSMKLDRDDFEAAVESFVGMMFGAMMGGVEFEGE